MQKAGEGASGLHPPSAPSSLCSHARDCHCKSSSPADRKANAGTAPTQGSGTSSILQGHGCTTRPHTAYFTCAKAAGNSKPRSLKEAEPPQTCAPTSELRSQNHRRKTKNPKTSSTFLWQEKDTLGIAHLWEETDPLDKHTRETSIGQSKQRLPEVSWRSQQSMQRGFWEEFLIRPWWLMAAGCLRPWSMELKSVWRRIQSLYD